MRTLDIEEVGKTTWHARSSRCAATSPFGDYFKEGAIRLAWTWSRRATPRAATALTATASG
ncbi:MAG: hypothetical protein R2734_00350 [Nocardioides sp.]